MPRETIGPPSPDRGTLDVEIAELRGLDVDDLRARWRTAFRRKAPPHLPRHLLFRVLAYRLQADRLGDLAPDVRRVLQSQSGVAGDNAKLAADIHRIRPTLKPGTVLKREWSGRLHHVMVVADGFSWSGNTYPSLSKVAFRDHRHPLEWTEILWLARPLSIDSATMTAKLPKTVRCAIYTRVSTDQGLDQEFNSLDAQYDASEAYIRSQAHAGWTLIRSRYDDGGFSGGSTERPALQRLLTDIKARKLDIIVVYKVDRLTRSLADFAKLVELFDAHDVFFVSVTQQFNTTTSMGRLTLNVLLSFAQFEREVTSERIRDKIGASKRKGLWVGGKAALGYEVKDHKIIVVEKDAERVRTIFRNYLKLGSINLLMADLRERNIFTKVQALKTGKTIGGIPFTSGPLGYLLRNRFYIGEVVYKGEILPGEQVPIVDRELFEAVQARLAEQQNNHTKTRAKSEALLTRLIFDDRGNRMTLSHARKKGIKYRYYISLPLLQGQPDRVGATHRVPADEIEKLVGDALRRKFEMEPGADLRNLVTTHLNRVEVQPKQLIVELKSTAKLESEGDLPREIIQVPWSKLPSKRRREIIVPEDKSSANVRPIRADARARLVFAIAQGQRWLDELATGVVPDTEAIAARQRCSVRKVNMTLSLAFLAPDLVKAAVEGRLPRGIGIARLCDPPAEWSKQYVKLGLARPQP